MGGFGRNKGACDAVDCPPDMAVGAGECCGQSPPVVQRRDRWCDFAGSRMMEMNPETGRCDDPRGLG